jgi:hypothetical protein
VQIVAIVLVHDEDVFVEQAIRNVAGFCDVIHAVDHVSSDGTWEILRRLERELGNVEALRTHRAGDSHTVIQRYAGTDTWVFGVDGDELYDPGRLTGFREQLVAGAYDHAFKIASNVVNCVELDRRRMTAAGYPSPPSRSITKLYNFAALESWAGDGAERLHGGRPVFRPGYDERTVDNIGELLSWDESPLRCLHMCFLPRSSLETEATTGPRPILEHSGMHDRSWRGALKRMVRPTRPPAETADWKREKYMRGDLVTVDATPFFEDQSSA